VTTVLPNDPLEVFEAFLQYMRNPPARSASARAQPATETSEPTGRRTAVAPPQAQPTASILVDSQSVWDEPTKSRPDVTRPFGQQTARKEPEQSIIVEDPAMTEPTRSAAPEVASRVGESPSERFCDEMMVLIKYGHAKQVPQEIERWIRTYPDDLEGAMRIAEFEMQRIDATQGLDRLFQVAHRALAKGAVECLRRALDRLQVLAPNDMRLAALHSRLGLRGP
jgi:hypothetical protein